MHAITGKKNEARKTLRELLPLLQLPAANGEGQEQGVDPGQIALIYIGLGQNQDALNLLEQAYHSHSPMMTWLKVDARFDAIRQEPRFQELQRGVGLV